MGDEGKSKKQLIQELTDARKRIAELEEYAAECKMTGADQGALEISLKRFKAFSESTFEGVVLAEGRTIIDMNDQLLQMMGYSRDQAIGADILPFIYPDDLSKVLPGILANQEQMAEHRMIRKDGSIIFVESHGKPWDIPGRKARIILIRDITERRRAEEELRDYRGKLEEMVKARTRELAERNSQLEKEIAEQKSVESSLRESESLYRFLTINADDIIFTLDLDLRFTFISPSVSRIRGFTVEEAMSQTLSEALTPASLEVAISAFAKELEYALKNPQDTSIVRSIELEETCKDGSTVWTETTFSFLRDHTNNLKGILGTTRDISERKRAERELRSASMYARRLIEASPDPLVTISPDGKVTDVNNATEDITGVPRKNLIGTNFSDYFTEPVKAQAGYEKVFREGFVRDYPLAIQHTSGKITQVLYNATTYRDENGQIQGVFAAARDIGELRQAQQALLESLDELETRNILLQEEIAEREKAEAETRRVEAQLAQAQRIEALDRFAGGIAHDLNNILYPIIINTEELLAEEREGSDRYEMLDQTLKAAYRQRDLVKKILSFSRRSERANKPVRVGALLEETLSFLRSSLPSTISIQENVHVQTDVVMGDPTQIQQVIVNLCKNAADALETGKGAIEIGLTNVRMKPFYNFQDMELIDYLKLTVKDTGMGMSHEVADRIFEPFFTKKDVGKGTGLGLPVVHGIVKSHSGAVRVESEEGKGSLFAVYLPISHEELPPHASDAESTPSVQNKESILLVDDEELILSSLQKTLKLSGYRVTALQNGQEALKEFNENPDKFDLVITDLTMPGMTGLELSQKLQEKRPGLPIILCTGFNDIISQQEAKSFGIKELLLKPAGSKDLKDAIRRAFAN
ncbi:MAG TPA: PAS domain S-box protein [Deltaproteobacteria bacterium]|nr:PAS domain S-box protein [Deltaproteobacteria bacterium]